MRDDWFDVEGLLGEEERALRDRVRTWCEDEVLGVIGDIWEAGEFPVDLFRGMADLGIVGGTIEGHGCPGLSPLAAGVVSAELARCDGSLVTFYGVQSSLAMRSIAYLGSTEQRDRWLPAMARLERLGCFALTEPDHGSDIVSMATTARRDGDHWVLDGAKRWIGNGTVADVAVVWAREDDGEVGGFVVDVDRAERGPDGGVAGWSAERITGKVGNRAVWQGHITLDGVRIPAEDRLVDARTFADTSRVLTASRAGVAWEALGHAEAAYDLAAAYATDREQFGEPIGSFQLVQNRLAGMLAELTSLRLLCVRLAQLDEVDLPTAALAKMQAARVARSLLADARSLLGGNGILLDHHVVRHHADIEAVFTYEGTDDVQSLIVGRGITGISAFT
ncbi:acyl-CoA dehydrogenase family protein [Euzebya sp.]|uniref:acyl-CoA dehydrogenase family protein n=1 Tax=Euzebya sp. TaxID=1971409 RepID=UPI0035177658